MSAEALLVMTIREFATAVSTAPNVDDFNDLVVRERMLGIQDLITSSVEFLRSEFPNTAIKSLGADLWDVIGNRWTPAAIGPVPTPTFIVTTGAAVIMFPVRWVDMLCTDSLMQIGALVFTGSQALDYFNKRLVGRELEARTRALAFEAEYLLAAAALSPTARFNKYQQDVVQRFPQGLASLDTALLYQRARCSALPPYRRGKPHAQ